MHSRRKRKEKALGTGAWRVMRDQHDIGNDHYCHRLLGKPFSFFRKNLNVKIRF
jgi:hypothetical protein